MNSDAVSKLKADPEKAGWVLGWGVYRMAPWHLQGVYDTEEKARAQADASGEGYLVSQGSHRLGSDDFVGWSDKQG
ncbi:hypothetical protein ACIOWB_24000 [Pseudomonas capeferrum]|uniref:hypothetical protein n=1 Tax=Pseudomonas capeferrum TaxID=1495066 RepID=UPI00382DF0D9